MASITDELASTSIYENFLTGDVFSSRHGEDPTAQEFLAAKNIARADLEEKILAAKNAYGGELTSKYVSSENDALKSIWIALLADLRELNMSYYGKQKSNSPNFYPRQSIGTVSYSYSHSGGGGASDSEGHGWKVNTSTGQIVHECMDHVKQFSTYSDGAILSAKLVAELVTIVEAWPAGSEVRRNTPGGAIYQSLNGKGFEGIDRCHRAALGAWVSDAQGAGMYLRL